MKIGQLEMWLQRNENTPFCIDTESYNLRKYNGNVRLDFEVKDQRGYPYDISVGYEMRQSIMPFVSNNDDPTRYGYVNGSNLGLILHKDPIYNVMDALDIPTQKVIVTVYSRDNIVDPQ